MVIAPCQFDDDPLRIGDFIFCILRFATGKKSEGNEVKKKEVF
jgi:hypothetical protein